MNQATIEIWKHHINSNGAMTITGYRGFARIAKRWRLLLGKEAYRHFLPGIFPPN
jgi:hypothetical protein